MRLTASSCLTLALAITLSAVALGDDENILTNGNFENGFKKWGYMWSEVGDECVKSELANKTQSAGNVHSGSHAAHLINTCDGEWAIRYMPTINVTYEERYEISYWTKVKGSPKFKMGAVPYNEDNSVLSWEISDAKTTDDTNGEWVHVTGYIWVTNKDTSYIVIQCIGYGEGEVYVDDITLKSVGKKPLFIDLSTGDKDSVDVRMNAQIGTISVTLPGTDLKWEQSRIWGPEVTEVVSYDSTSAKIELNGGYKVTISITKGVPEVVYKISSNGTKELDMYPHPFNSSEGHAIIPVNEGISFPINSGDKFGLNTFSLATGYGLCMAFW